MIAIDAGQTSPQLVSRRHTYFADPRAQLLSWLSPRKEHHTLGALFCARRCQTINDSLEDGRRECFPSLFAMRCGLTLRFNMSQYACWREHTSCARTVRHVFNSNTPCRAQLVR